MDIEEIIAETKYYSFFDFFYLWERRSLVVTITRGYWIFRFESIKIPSDSKDYIPQNKKIGTCRFPLKKNTQRNVTCHRSEIERRCQRMNREILLKGHHWLVVRREVREIGSISEQLGLQKNPSFFFSSWGLLIIFLL